MRVLLQVEYGFGSDTYNFDSTVVDLDLDTGRISLPNILIRFFTFLFRRYKHIVQYPYGYSGVNRYLADIRVGRVNKITLENFRKEIG